MLHTILPLEAVLGEDSGIPAPEQSAVAAGYLETDSANGQRIVRRLISTDPRAYLDSSYAPGAVIK